MDIRDPDLEALLSPQCIPVYLPGKLSKRALFTVHRCILVGIVSRLTYHTGGVGFTESRAITVGISVRAFTAGTIAQFAVCVCIVTVNSYHQ
jgi:hypothetical protein